MSSLFTTMHQRAARGARSFAVAGALGLLLASLAGVAQVAQAHAASLCGATDTKCVITFGDAAIAARQTVLSKLNSRITEVYSDGRISSDDNSALVGDVSTNESGLTTLKGQLDAATDAATARADVKLIYTQFRIFAVVLPRDYHQLWLDMIAHTDARLTGAEPVIQDAINGAPASVQGQANTLYSDYKTQVATANAQTQAAAPLYAQLTPANFDQGTNGNYQSTFDMYKTDIQTAHTATQKAISDLHQIYELLKSAS